jgi:hypothetical protein
MPTRFYLKNTTYPQNWYPSAYNQGATAIVCPQIRYDAGTGAAGAYFACDTLGSFSTDGINWKDIGTNGPIGALNQMCYMLNNVWWLGSTTGVLYRLTSTDGVWTSVHTNSAASQWNDMIVANGYYVATASSGILSTSTNGSTWTQNSSAATVFGGSAIWSVAYSSSLNLFVATGSAGLLATATDPTGTWTARTSSFATSPVYYCIWSTSLSLFVAVGSSGKIATSSNGTAWTQQTSGITTNIYAIAANGTQLVAGGSNSVILRSTNGTAWTNARPLPSEVSATLASNIFAIIAGSTAGEFWLCGGVSLLYKSTDSGVTWTPQGTETSTVASYADNTTLWNTRINVLREMNDTVGTAQATLAQTAPALTTAILTFWGTWASRPLTAAATVGGGSMVLNFAGIESNASSNWLGTNGLLIYVWRPSTNAKVGTIKDFTGTAASVITEVGTSETVRHATGITSSAVSALAGDIVVVELWSTHTPGMATAYINTFYYNGTTINTTNLAAVTNHASFIEFAETFSVATIPRNYTTVITG